MRKIVKIKGKVIKVDVVSLYLDGVEDGAPLTEIGYEVTEYNDDADLIAKKFGATSEPKQRYATLTKVIFIDASVVYKLNKEQYTRLINWVSEISTYNYTFQINENEFWPVTVGDLVLIILQEGCTNQVQLQGLVNTLNRLNDPLPAMVSFVRDEIHLVFGNGSLLAVIPDGTTHS